MKQKLPVVAWLTKTEGFDGVGVYGARTEAGARGFNRRAAAKAGYEGTPADFKCEVLRIYPLDKWVAAQDHGGGGGIAYAIATMLGDRADAFRATLAAMRRGGNGLTHTQEQEIAGAIGLAE